MKARDVIISKDAHPDFFTVEYRKREKTVLTINYDEIPTQKIQSWLAGASVDSLKRDSS